ncbi:MAG: prepilin-type N-terminal cleavage/methylation domain-containing protein [Candidatus Omnitrophica bacterium]|nr:prepilin-type N-terminal cleavage/methylation domain-containing protein [Candidatus Omnitrophota bacterium]
MDSSTGFSGRVDSGFTLIELLIVIAIILILIAIALPNFIEAQNRARVTTAKANQRGIQTALEAYQTDFRQYPVGWHLFSVQQPPIPANFPEDLFVRWRLKILTTPIAYLTQLPESPFLPDCYKHSGGCSEFINDAGVPYNPGSEYEQDGGWYDHPNMRSAGAHGRHPVHNRIETWSGTMYHLRDAGPDGIMSNSDLFGQTVIAAYNPTNGSKSLGDIWTFGP